jgi:hypothetical protein
MPRLFGSAAIPRSDVVPAARNASTVRAMSAARWRPAIRDDSAAHGASIVSELVGMAVAAELDAACLGSIRRPAKLRRASRATLAREVDEVFLPSLKRGGISAGGAFRVHCEPHRPDDNPDNASGDILNDLCVLLRCERLSAAVVRLYLGIYH